MSLKPTETAIPSYRQRLSYHSGLLGGVGLLTGAALAIAHVETHQAIETAKAEEQRALLAQVIPATLYDNNLLADRLKIALPQGGEREVFIGRKNNQVTAVAYELSEPGYSGAIRVLLGLDQTGKVLGTRTLSHTETPGLGDKIEIAKNPWVLSFDGKSLQDPGLPAWGVKKDGGVFDQFTGATITPRAYVKAVKEGLMFFEAHRAQIVSSQAPVPVPVPTVVAPPTPASSQGSR